MKKIFTLSAALLLLAGTMAFAQEQKAPAADHKQLTPEQRAEMKADRITEKLLLSDEAAAKFKPLYKTYTLETQAINKKYRPEIHKGTPKTDAEIDSDIRKGFQKSQEILNLRIAYYEKFIKILSPRQVREMYRIEKEQAEKAQFHKYMKNHPGDCHNGHKPCGK